MMAKSRPRWIGRRLEQSIDVLQKDQRRAAHLDQPVDLPPEDALLTLDAVSLMEELGDGVVLTGEAADQQVVVGKGPLAALDGIEYGCDVLIHVFAARLAEVAVVAVEGVLDPRARLPLVARGRPASPLRSSPMRKPPTPANNSITRPPCGDDVVVWGERVGRGGRRLAERLLHLPSAWTKGTTHLGRDQADRRIVARDSGRFSWASSLPSTATRAASRWSPT